MAPSNSQKFSWVKGRAIGSGSFGAVHLATDKATGAVFAVKSAHAESETAFESLKNESDILRTLSSPHVVRCLGTEEAKEGIVMFMEYAEGGTLSDAVATFGGGGLHEQAIRYYTREILHGLGYLHRNGIVHCDLKCKNVLLAGSSDNRRNNSSVKLADFGCARRRLSSKRNTSKIGGTLLWMAPEVLLRNEEEFLDPKSDIWSLGCTVIEMATGLPPWFGEVSSREAAILKIAGTDHVPPFPKQGLSKEGIDFLKKCLERDPKRRWSAEELLLHHPFVSSIPRQQQQQLENHVDSPVSVLTFGCYHDSVDNNNNNTESEESTTEDEFELVKKRMHFGKYWQLEGSEFFGSSSGSCWITVR